MPPTDSSPSVTSTLSGNSSSTGARLEVEELGDRDGLEASAEQLGDQPGHCLDGRLPAARVVRRCPVVQEDDRTGVDVLEDSFADPGCPGLPIPVPGLH